MKEGTKENRQCAEKFLGPFGPQTINQTNHFTSRAAI